MFLWKYQITLLLISCAHFILAFLEYHNITMTYVIDAPSIEDVTLKLPKCYLATGNL